MAEIIPSLLQIHSKGYQSLFFSSFTWFKDGPIEKVLVTNFVLSGSFSNCQIFNQINFKNIIQIKSALYLGFVPFPRYMIYWNFFFFKFKKNLLWFINNRKRLKAVLESQLLQPHPSAVCAALRERLSERAKCVVIA